MAAKTMKPAKPIPRKRKRCPNPVRVKRQYTDEERAQAIAFCLANGLNVSKTARQLGIPKQTLHQWVNDGVAPPDVQRVEEIACSLEAKLEAFLVRAMEIDPREFPLRSFLEHAEAIGILVDTLIKLRDCAGSVLGRMRAQENEQNESNAKPRSDLNTLNPREINVLTNLFGKLSEKTDVFDKPRAGAPDHENGRLDDPAPLALSPEDRNASSGFTGTK